MTDSLRATVILAGGVLFGMTAMVFISYAQLVRRNRRALLPKHVAAVSLSYCLLIALVIADQGWRLTSATNGQGETTWRLWFAMPAMTLGVVALYLLLKSLRPSPHSGPERRRRTDRRRRK